MTYKRKKCFYLKLCNSFYSIPYLIVHSLIFWSYYAWYIIILSVSFLSWFSCMNKRVNEFILIFVLHSLLLCTRWIDEKKKNSMNILNKTFSFCVLGKKGKHDFSLFLDHNEFSSRIKKKEYQELFLKYLSINLLRIEQEKLWLNLKLKFRYISIDCVGGGKRYKFKIN